MNLPNNYIVFDIETTGFDGKKDKITEIGALKIVEDKIISTFNVLLNWDIEIPSHITELTTITKELLDEEGISPEAAYLEFLHFIGNEHTVLGHNVIRFDIPFITGNFNTFNSLDMRRVLDTAVLYKAHKVGMEMNEQEAFTTFANRVLGAKHYGVKYSMDSAISEFGIDKSAITQHRALGDCFLTNELYKILCQKQNQQKEIGGLKKRPMTSAI